MSQGNIAFVVSIILLSVLACAIIALIICAIKCKKGKTVFLVIAAALVVVLTATCIAMLISYNRSKPAKETKLQPLTPEVLRYMERLPGADILSSEYSSVSVSYDFSDETSDVNNASGYYMLDYGGLHGIDNPELSEMAGDIKILYKVDNDVYVLYTLIASS